MNKKVIPMTPDKRQYPMDIGNSLGGRVGVRKKCTLSEFEENYPLYLQARQDIYIEQNEEVYVRLVWKKDILSKAMGTDCSFWITGMQGSNPSKEAMIVFGKVLRLIEGFEKTTLGY